MNLFFMLGYPWPSMWDFGGGFDVTAIMHARKKSRRAKSIRRFRHCR